MPAEAGKEVSQLPKLVIDARLVLFLFFYAPHLARLEPGDRPSPDLFSPFVEKVDFARGIGRAVTPLKWPAHGCWSGRPAILLLRCVLAMVSVTLVDRNSKDFPQFAVPGRANSDGLEFSWIFALRSRSPLRNKD